MPQLSKKISRGRQNWQRSLLLLGLTVCLTTGLIIGILWWLDRPLAQAERLLEQDQYGQALSLIDESLKSRPQNSRALALKARTLTAMGRWSEAVHIFEHVGVDDAKDVHSFAQARLHQQQWSHALPLLERLMELDSTNADVLHEITACRSRLGLFDAALDSAKQYAELPGLESRGHLLVGTIHRSMQNKRLATAAFARVLETNPNAEDLHVPADEFFLEYGTLFLETGRPRDALQQLKHSVSLRSTAQGHALIGKAHLQLGQPELAKDAWLRAVTEESSHQVAREALAQYALLQSSAQEAIQWLLPLTFTENLQSSTAYLLQRAYTILNDRKKSDFWRERAAVLRKKELFNATIEKVLVETPQSFWARAIRAYRLVTNHEIRMSKECRMSE